MVRLLRLLLFVLFSLSCAVVAHAVVTPHGLFCDNVVLQRDASIPVWGIAAPGEKITVSLATRHAKTVAGPDGAWMVHLRALHAGGPYDLRIAGDNTVLIHGVLIGEVWLASGQSNMEYGVGAVLNAQQEIAAADYPLIHVFTVPTVVADAPQTTVSGAWQRCSPQTVGGFSGTAYFFARELYAALHVPIGIIHSSVSGTLAEAWTSTEALQRDPDLLPIVTRYQGQVAQYQQELRTYPDTLATWQAAVKKAQADGVTPPPQPKAPEDPSRSAYLHVSGLFNGKIAPLLPYRIRGIIWWQGEYNSGRGEQYRKLFPALIRDWRDRWGLGDLPFYFVQLQNLYISQPSDAHYTELREAQLFTRLNVPNTGMVVACDFGDRENIHPPNKQEAGRRLARIALRRLYGQKLLIDNGPLYQGYQVEGAKIRVAFTETAGGLLVKNSPKLASFEIAGADRHFVAAEAAIDGKTVVVWSDAVSYPVAVRYGWTNFDDPLCTLYNTGNLPASPFRTDDWPIASTGLR